MTQRRYNIRPNAGCVIPTQHVILDTETYQEVINERANAKRHRLRLGAASFFRFEGGVVSRCQSLSFVSADNFFSWLTCRLRKRASTWVWAHNAVFDWTVVDLWSQLETTTFRPKLVCLSGPPTFICTTGPYGPCTFVDSLNWWRTSLAVLGESVTIPKLLMPEPAAPDAAWENYCRQDVAILQAATIALLQFVRDNNLGCLRLSASSQSMQAYRHRFAPTIKVEKPPDKRTDPDIPEHWTFCLPLVHRSQDTLDLERRAYTMGAIRAYHINVVDGPIYCLDTNSAYPAVMRDELFPCKLIAAGRCRNDSVDASDYLGQDTIADVLVNVDEPIYPLRLAGNIVFPVGEFATTLAGPELSYALANKHIVRAWSFAEYQLAPLFTGYVGYLYSMRQNYERTGQRAWAETCKLLLNSLAGKFGQWEHSWQRVDDVEYHARWGMFNIVDYETKHIRRFRSIAGLVEEEIFRRVRTSVDTSGNVVLEREGQLIRNEHPNSFPAICAFVNSYARLRIWRAIKEVQKHGSCYYSAVDSIHCDRDGYSALERAGMVGPGLGQLRLVKIAQTAEYRGLANYSLDSTLHCAGVNRHGQWVDRDTMRQTAFPTAAQLLSGQKPTSIITCETTHKMRPPYRHGKLCHGGVTRPWVLPDEYEEMVRCLKSQ